VPGLRGCKNFSLPKTEKLSEDILMLGSIHLNAKQKPKIRISFERMTTTLESLETYGL
jgi:hypothetical protein